MEMSSCSEPGAFAGQGEWTTFYAYEGEPARSGLLAGMARMLVRSGPVLLIDWDLESPGLHHRFGREGERPGLLEFFDACRAQLAQAGGHAGDAEGLACRVLDAVDWRDFVERVDAERPLFLMRAGRMDATYGERAAALDWTALFHACPALLRQFRTRMAAAFRHVCIDARGGRSPAVSVCTSLLPDTIVGLFTPLQPSLEGLCGVVERAMAYRCTHEDDQRPLLFFPVPCAPRSDHDTRWRRGTLQQPGYQGVLEALLATSYGYRHLSLEHYFDQLPAHPSAAPALCDWLDGHRMPWLVSADMARNHDVPAATGEARRMRQLADSVETQLDHLQQLVDRHSLREARPVADRLRDLVLRPAVTHGLRRRGAALIKQVYRHDNDTDALLSFTQDELATLERVLHEAAAGRPWAFS